MTPDELHAMRAQLQLTQAEFGALVEVDGTTVDRWERGLDRPTPAQRDFLTILWRMASTEMELVGVDAD